MKSNEISDNSREWLGPAEAIELWKKGRDSWNKWVTKNPEASISFEYVDFSELIDKRNIVSFSGFIFPEGLLDFSYAKFGDAKVMFSQSKIHSLQVYFNFCEFLGGCLLFDRTEIGFDRSYDFKLRFNIHDCKVGEDWRLITHSCYFSNVAIHINKMIFNTDFLLQIGGAPTKVSRSNLKPSEIFISDTTFFSQVRIQNVGAGKLISKLSLSNNSFEGPLYLPKGRLDHVPDLLNTKFAHQVTFHDLKCDFSVENFKLWKIFDVTRSSDLEDAARLRRLKEIAEENKDHPQALRLMAREMRARRWHPELMSNAASLMDLAFDKLSSYGRSIKKPVVMWLVQLVAFIAVFFGLSEKLDWPFYRYSGGKL